MDRVGGRGPVAAGAFRAETDVEAQEIMNATGSSGPADVRVEIDDVQSGALRPRPVPYEGEFIFLRVDDRHAGRALLRRLLPVTSGGLPGADRSQDAWVAVAFTYQGLKALGVPRIRWTVFRGRSVRAWPPGRR